MAKPHDSLFKLVFWDPDHAACELRHLLPAATRRQIDWSSLKLLESSGVDGEFRQYHADLLFSARLREREELVYFIVEHKSTPAPCTPLQLFGYVNRSFELFHDESSKRLPQVVCVVVYHGAGRWRFGTNTLDATDAVPGLWPDPARCLANLPFLVDDLTSASAEALRARDMPPLARLALFCLKRARPSKDLLAELRPWLKEVRTVFRTPDPTEAHFGLFRYIMETTDLPYARFLEFLRAEVGQPAEELLKTTYQRILEEGEAKGEAKGMAAVLLKLLDKRFGTVPQDIVDRVRVSSIEELGQWAERVLSVESLDQVFAEE